MAERLIEVFSGSDPEKDLKEMLEEKQMIDYWTVKTSEELWQTKILALAENSEKILDSLEQRFTQDESFRAIIFQVEASLPRAQEEEKEEENQATEEENKPKKGIFKRISREELYHDISEMISNDAVDIAMIILSAIVATIGLVRNSPAIIIGAMVIAPMLGPNVAQSFATTLGDFGLLAKSVRTNLIRIGLGFAFALVFGLLFRLDYTTHEITSRTVANLGDIVLAFASGTAAALSITSGVSTSLIGVMVAVSLMPPLAAAGMLLGSGNIEGFSGAILLFFVNIVCINLASIITFRLQGIEPRSWWEANKAGKAVRVTIIGWVVVLGLLALSLFLSEVL
ncbi:MAG TPA: TIGR00341 family protein [Mesotoga infera]|uniref:TIGR00341 family protein n=1 Tax=Mesotoga infera TaxID=1236046 RepID=A0A3D3TPD7_9BACT|nr:MAG: TIGR00341 family protein [Thermotogales bacterium 46_20]HCO70477.1 TIGR00341 family protein [Mesotoga infera]